MDSQLTRNKEVMDYINKKHKIFFSENAVLLTPEWCGKLLTLFGEQFLYNMEPEHLLAWVYLVRSLDDQGISILVKSIDHQIAEIVKDQCAAIMSLQLGLNR